MKFAISFLFLSCIGLSTATTETTLKFHSCEVQANNKLADANCSLSTDFGESKISTFINVVDNITAIRAQARLNLFLPLGSPVTLIDHTEPDVCMQLRPSSVANVLVATINEFRDIGHFPEQCPVSPGVYYLKGLFIPSSFLPAYLPPGKFQIELRLYGKTDSDEVLLFYDLSIRVSIEPSGPSFGGGRVISGKRRMRGMNGRQLNWISGL